MKKLFHWFVDFIRNMDWAEVWRYFIIGVCTTSLNWFLFWLLTVRLGVNELLGNIVAWITATTFAFFTNSLYVFRVKPENAGELLRFGAKFFGERLFTLGVEELILLVFITLMKFPPMPVKIAATCVTIALNYFISKLLIFRQKDKEASDL